MFSTTPTWRISAVAAVLAIALAGCGDDDNAGPTAPSGGTAVTAENAGQVQTALMSTFAGVAAKGLGDHPGASSGRVVIEIATGKQTQAPGARFSMAFDNYSDDGALFIAGNLTYETGEAITVTGDLDLSGTYEGSVGLDLSVSGAAATGTISVNGTTVDIGSPGAGGGDMGGGDAGVGENKVVYGSATVDVETITCNPNTFGIPRFVFDAKNADNSVSANVALRGSAPEDGSTFTLDPELGGGSSRVKLYYDSKNWTNELNADNMVAFVSDGTKRRVHGTDIVVANDRDASETMVVTFNIACE